MRELQRLTSGMLAAVCAITFAVDGYAVERLGKVLPTLIGTFSVQHLPQQSRGVLEGCSLEFDVIFEDWKYRDGHLARAEVPVEFRLPAGRAYAAIDC